MCMLFPIHLLLYIYTEIIDIYQTVIIDLRIDIILKMLFLQQKVCKILV